MIKLSRKTDAMNRSPLFFFLALFLTLAAAPNFARAEENYFDKAEKHYQKVTQECQSESQPKWDTGNTMTMQEGTYDYLQCLTDEITKISDIYFVDSHQPDDKEEFLASLKAYTKEAFILYQHIHYGPCSPCGTQHIPMRVMDVAARIENILKDMLIYAYEYERPIERPDKN